MLVKITGYNFSLQVWLCGSIRSFVLHVVLCGEACRHVVLCGEACRHIVNVYLIRK
jgi:hypothetical protein